MNFGNASGGVRLAARAALFFACALALAAPRPARALPPFGAVVKAAYKPAPGGAVDKATAACTLCHAEAGKPALNPYGVTLKGALGEAKTKNLTAAVLAGVEAADSDGDRFPNGAEIKADTLPGSAESKPEGEPPAAGATTPPPPAPPADAAEERNPWAVKTLLFPNHAQHPVVVHFPIALFVVALLFDFLGFRQKNSSLLAAGFYNLVVAAVTSLGAMITGFGAWWWAYGQAPFTGNLLWHLVLATVSFALIWAMLYLRMKYNKNPTPGKERLYLALGAVAFAIISITGHLGGELVGLT